MKIIPTDYSAPDMNSELGSEVGKLPAPFSLAIIIKESFFRVGSLLIVKFTSALRERASNPLVKSAGTAYNAVQY